MAQSVDPSASVTDLDEKHIFQPPTERVSNKYLAVLVIAYLIFYAALLGPAIVGIGVKVQTIVPADQKASALAQVASVGALCAVLANVICGRLSDRTTSRWGRRRIWIVSGTIVMTIGFLVMALGRSVPVVMVGWALAQLGANGALAPLVASVSLPPSPTLCASYMVRDTAAASVRDQFWRDEGRRAQPPAEPRRSSCPS